VLFCFHAPQVVFDTFRIVTKIKPDAPDPASPAPIDYNPFGCKRAYSRRVLTAGGHASSPRADTRAIGALASRRSIGRAGVAPGRALRARGGTGPALARIGRCATCGSAHGAGPLPAELTGTEEHRIARAALARRRKIGHGAALAPELHARHSPLS
jgi:hypothetical protein